MNTNQATTQSVTIDVVSDVVCPWCYIGKRRLEEALATLRTQEPETVVTVRWHPFELNPELPREGIARSAYTSAKFGGPERAAQIYDRVRTAGRAVGIPFEFERIERQPNTRDAHRLIAWAQQQGDAEVLVERLFRAYFLEGRFVGDHAELALLAADAGYDAAAVSAMLASPAMFDVVEAGERQAFEMGVTGVPFLLFDGTVALSGAQVPAIMLDALAQARNSQGQLVKTAVAH